MLFLFFLCQIFVTIQNFFLTFSGYFSIKMNNTIKKQFLFDLIISLNLSDITQID